MSIQQVRRSILVAIGAGALAAAGLVAGRVSADAFGHGGRADFAPRMFSRLSRVLGLNDDQKARVKEVLKAHADEIEAQLTASAEARRALHDAVVAQPADEATIRARAADVGRVHGDGAVLLARIRTEIDPILTADQRQKLGTFDRRIRGRADAAARSFDAFVRGGS
jgi:Spy/CpxP family protein refolding chaperone